MSFIANSKITFWPTLAVIVLLYAFSSIIYQMYSNDWPTGDEHWHYSYSERLLQKGLTERASIHNYNSTTPGTVLNVISQNTYAYLTGDRSFSKFFARLPQILWFVLLIYAAFTLAARYFPDPTKWIALILIGLDQNLHAHAAVIGTDLQFAAATLVVLLLALDYWRKPNWWGATVLGLSLGLAFVAKYSASFLVLPAVILVIATTFYRWRWFRALLVSPLHVFVVGGFCCLLVNMSYGFIGSGDTFSQREWYYQLFKRLAASIPNIPLPLPVDFISGFDHQLAAERSWDWNGILLGQELKSGVWYFFMLCWLIKTPLAIVLLAVLALLCAAQFDNKLWRNSAFICASALFVLFLGYFSFVFRVHVGLRYALMCIPLAYLLIAALLTQFKHLRLFTSYALLLLLLAGIEIFPYYGNSLAFTNGIVWPKSSVYKWIADSNVDWNQNHKLAQAQAQRSLEKYVFNPPHIVPGYNLFTVNHLAGVYRNFNKHKWVREHLEPIGQFGFTTILFNIGPADFANFMAAQRTFEQPNSALDICHPKYLKVPLANGTLPPLVGSWANERLYSACLLVSKTLTVELKVNQGRAYAGAYPREHNCEGTEVGPGESLWFKFEPGIHPICARVVQNLTGSWIVHSGKAERALRIFP